LFSAARELDASVKARQVKKKQAQRWLGVAIL
jgi:hypothetical protein